MKSNTYKLIEFFIIFILIPISFALDYSPFIKLSVGFVGFLYVIYLLLKVERKKFKIAQGLNWKQFWRETVIKLAIIAVLTTLFVWFTDKARLFEVLLNKPLLWVVILFVYSVFSVYPQELIYRTLFFERYAILFQSTSFAIVLNAVVFSLAHIMFKSTLVLVLTFLGGLLFALTYTKTKSTLLVSIEHAIYGSWLFTVGMGTMLGFPS
ncbi:CPBP family intramembrane glutamic endopeptidase [Meridianimaribacter flavus]|uniref:CAAX prenyl protease-like protein n=1 Tax=Meridianimaribacter flavus TaxID=571115 RepID=A0ABY2G695_9FLAO|nr:CPBP family intramembrane glutamic endopeptidase [Meridianimaribacter flavus]TDY12566.1 CAAX prenyl protease-like protein [Meridianimaribacter flavus]